MCSIEESQQLRVPLALRSAPGEERYTLRVFSYAQSSLEELCQCLKKPRKVMLMVKAGFVVDQVRMPTCLVRSCMSIGGLPALDAKLELLAVYRQPLAFPRCRRHHHRRWQFALFRLIAPYGGPRGKRLPLHWHRQALFRDCPLYPYAHDTSLRAITVRCIRRRAWSADGSFNNAGRICGGVENHKAHISGNQRAH